MCEYCERSYSELEYDDLQTVCECGRLITSKSHVLPVRRRLTKKQCAPVGFQTTFPEVDFLFHVVFQAEGTQPTSSQIGSPIAQNSEVAPALNLTLGAECTGRRIRYCRKSTPTCTPGLQLLPASFAESRHVTTESVHFTGEAENRQAAPSSPQKHSINHAENCQVTPSLPKRRSVDRAENWQATPSSPQKRSVRQAQHWQAAPGLPKKHSICQAKNWKSAPSSPKKRNIGQIAEARKEVHIKKQRCSLPRSWCAGGA